MEQTTRRIAYVTGFLGAIIISLGALLAGWKYRDADGGTFSIFNHFVSELGHTVNSQWALLFNGALVIGSLCLGIHLFCLAFNFEGSVSPAAAAYCALLGAFSECWSASFR